MKSPIALTIAGSDSSGGAGIQADLKTFQVFGVHGVSVITSVTAQNSIRLIDSFDLPPELISKQVRALFDDFRINAIKTGMLSNSKIIAAISNVLAQKKVPHLVVDPVMISKSGFKLLQSNALKALKEKLLPIAHLVTPNVDEAEILSGMKINSIETMKEAAKKIHQFGPRVLIKGGHAAFQKACDLFWDGNSFHLFRGHPIRKKTPHGTGCVFSAAIAAELALGKTLPESIAEAKKFIERAIRDSVPLGKGNPLLFF